ncbi:hypothetical protein V492_00603 [Pseudogymnoascus sp. VKM F-4246]|nr:hypothetical protein V492_00603 [Pseudogymnoascus sp. VKM F-4246]
MFRRALHTRGGLFSNIYRPRDGEIQRCLATSQRRDFYIFPQVRYDDSSTYGINSNRDRPHSISSATILDSFKPNLPILRSNLHTSSYTTRSPDPSTTTRRKLSTHTAKPGGMIQYKRIHTEMPPLTASDGAKLESVLGNQYLTNIQLDNVNTRLDILTDKLDELLNRPTSLATELHRLAREPQEKGDSGLFRHPDVAALTGFLYGMLLLLVILQYINWGLGREAEQPKAERREEKVGVDG